MQKLCKKCDTKKPTTDFYLDKKTKDGLFSYCKACSAAQSRYWAAKNFTYRQERAKQYRLANREKVRATSRKYYRDNSVRLLEKKKEKRIEAYGISLAEYGKMLKRQKGRCAVCRKPPPTSKRLCIDHCHASGKVRGLLCGTCNTAIGKMKDDPSLLRAAAAYLEVT